MKTPLRTSWLWLALVLPAWNAASESSLRAADAPAGGAAAALKKPMALSFDRNTFEASLQIVSEEIGLPIEFVGPDLVAAGLPKHTSFGLDEKEQPAGQLLRTIFKKVDPEGRLVYVIKPKLPGGPETIFVGTRDGVEQRKEKLPQEFVIAKETTVKPKPGVKPKKS